MKKLTALSFAVGLSILWSFTVTATTARADDDSAPDEPDDDAFAVEQPSDPAPTPEPTPSETPPKTFEKLPTTEGDGGEPAPPRTQPEPSPPADAPTTDSRVQTETTQPQGPVTVQTFHTALSPHGTWYDTNEYGWVWRPRVWTGWRPYTYGRWLYTNHGWTWRSYHRWGWAPFHYGRWFVHSSLGWSWVPGTAWAPAWVSWRHTGGHVGWAPVPPGYSSYTSVSAYPLVHASHWTFVPGAYIVTPRLYRHTIHHSHPTYATIYRASVYSPVYTRVGRVAHAGPQPVVLARTIGRVVKAIPIVAVAQPGGRATVRGIPIYRPVVRAIAAQTRPVVGVRGVAFSGGRPGAVVATTAMRKPLGIAATPTIARWRPVAVSPANVIRTTYVPHRTTTIRPATTTIRPTVIRPGIVRPTRTTTLPPRTSVIRATRPHVRPPRVSTTASVAKKPTPLVRPVTPIRTYNPRSLRPVIRPQKSVVHQPYKPRVYVPSRPSKAKKKGY